MYPQKKTNHIRSSSNPSIPHPLAIKTLEKLHSIKTRINVPKPSFTTISTLLGDFAELLQSLHLLLRLPSLHLLLSQNSHKTWLEAQLDCSLQLLDIEAPITDCLASAKTFAFDLQSALRRRGDNAYLSSRKKGQKIFLACFKLLKKMEEGFVVATLDEKDGDLVMVDGLLREVRVGIVVLFQILLNFVEISARRKRILQWGRGSGWGNVKAVGLELLLSCAFERILGKDDESWELKRKANEELNQVEIGIEGLEIGLQLLFRRIIQNRVVLLNMLSF